VQKAVEIAHSKWGSKSAKIRALAINIINSARVDDKDYYGMIVAVHNWVRDQIRYVKDPVGQETLSYPEETALNTKAGDCDDKTVLEIALLGSLGIRSYPVVIGTQAGGSFSHIYLHALVPPGKHRNALAVVPLDPIMRQWRAGQEAPASKVKRKKLYTALTDHYGAPPMNGDHLGYIGDYVTGPSYLDTENSQAGAIMANRGITREGNVDNGTKVVQGMEGIDGMMGPPTGGFFTENSAGDGGTVLESAGQMVPAGFVRREPNLHQIMHQDAASKAELGPRGPMFAQRAGQQTEFLDRGKRYENAPLNHKNRRIDAARPKQVTVNAGPFPISREDRPVPNTVQGLSGELAGILSRITKKISSASQAATLAEKSDLQRQLSDLMAQKNELEKRILALRQRQQQRAVAQLTPVSPVRAEQVNAQMPPSVRPPITKPASQKPGWQRAAWGNPPRSVNGMGGFMDTVQEQLTKPYVVIPFALLMGFLVYKKFFKRRSASTTPA
jgi:hypothetical protein